MPHRTTGLGKQGGGGPWLTSLVMWSNLMRFVDDAGVAVGELDAAGGNLAGMERWGCRDPAGSRRASTRPAPRDVDRPADRRRPGGASNVGAPLRRHRRPLDGPLRRGVRRRAALVAGGGRRPTRPSAARIPPGAGLRPARGGSRSRPLAARRPSRPSGRADAHLSVLLSQVLLAFTLDFERESRLSLAISANVMRLLGDAGVTTRDLPRVTGLSKEAIKMAVGFLERSGLVALSTDAAGSRTRTVALTRAGREAQTADREVLAAVEERWDERFGGEGIRGMRRSLESLVGAGDRMSPLFAGLTPYPDGWRASVRRPETLPHHPVPLHRGGYPDGS